MAASFDVTVVLDGRFKVYVGYDFDLILGLILDWWQVLFQIWNWIWSLLWLGFNVDFDFDLERDIGFGCGV